MGVVSELKDLMSKDESGGNQSTGRGGGGGGSANEKGGKSLRSFMKMDGDDDADSDKLNLAELLNIFDGIVDSPGRMIIITTNCPDKLDSALTRPGRIDLKIEMRHVVPLQVKAMLEHFFKQQLTPAQSERIEKLLNPFDLDMDISAIDARKVPSLDKNFAHSRACTPQFSPAEIEQLCATHTSIDTLLDELFNMTKVFARDRAFKLPSLSRQVSYQQKVESWTL